VASICFIEGSWLLRRLRACFQSKIPFLTRKCAHLVVSAHISPQVKNLTQVCEGEKQSRLLLNISPLCFWRQIKLVVHFREKFLSFLCCEVEHHVLKMIFITMSKRTCFIFQPIFSHFSGKLAGLKAQRS